MDRNFETCFGTTRAKSSAVRDSASRFPFRLESAIIGHDRLANTLFASFFANRSRPIFTELNRSRVLNESSLLQYIYATKERKKERKDIIISFKIGTRSLPELCAHLCHFLSSRISRSLTSIEVKSWKTKR